VGGKPDANDVAVDERINGLLLIEVGEGSFRTAVIIFGSRANVV
jgi:hypothetical protein